ncbi:Uu.00g124930.m01.CDS01 [Anthostomella pinea]|uniref:Uu.00g124930.m01.CDS01 n=1 Tax=Anthostomella pinea TaxID=933095 RepID=A0AAI8YHM7_9PEZI|nr:Uu.00g124930.m01.CDS01 [Anthostomella pinea]
MSHLLWKHYWENDVDKFRRLLAPAGYTQTLSKRAAAGVGSPGALGSSPRAVVKSRKSSGFGAGFGGPKNAGNNLGKAEVNSRDHSGLTILLRAASSTSSNAVDFVQALLDHPAIDLYVQDPESGWNALHRALYNGNISIARVLLGKERRDLTESLAGIAIARVGQLIKTKDHEGNSPFDVYNATIALRSLKVSEDGANSDDEAEPDEGAGSDDLRHHTKSSGLGEEVFTFGSNKNFSLGLGDEDDRQFPERIFLKRPDHLVHYFHDQYLQGQRRQPGMGDSISRDIWEVPALIRNRPLIIQDVVLSKLHSAILTTDPISNLYICGIGRGGRLGLGDENTRFSFMPVQGGLLDRKVTQVALGQNHSMAITSSGELWTWGSNTYSQLGFVLPAPLKPDEEPISTTPRQVFGPLKKEIVLGAAASSIHSVAHTGSSLFCWGKNIGQLALMDADSRSLEVQTNPRKVAAARLRVHSSIIMVSAIDKATCCLFEDRAVCVFTSYGYNMISFPFSDGFTTSTRRLSRQFSSFAPDYFKRLERTIHQITSGGDTIAAVTGSGDLFTMQLNHISDGNHLSSTTNPAKIKDAITTPKCIWSSGKDGVKCASVGENGAVIISTQSGAVWRRVKRTKAKDTKTPGMSDSKRKDFKFQRVPYITDVVAVSSSIFGAYAAVRKDCDVARDQLEVDEPTFWQDLAPLLPLQDLRAQNSKARENKDTWKFQNPDVLKGRVDDLAFEVLTSTNLEEDLGTHLRNWSFANEGLGTAIRTASNPELVVPIHSWVLSARSSLFCAGLQRFRDTGNYEVPELLTISEEQGVIVIELTGSIDLITLLNLVVYMYTDRVIPAWNFTRQSPPLAYRYRQIRTELMKLATRLGMAKLEAAARTQSSPARSMNEDFRRAIEDTAFFEDGDALLELDGDDIPVHSALLCERCPWFHGLFNGRSGGKWLESRRAALEDSDRVNIDLQHMDPEAFHYVLQYLYADVGEDLFDTVVADSIDDFSELVMDVLSIANELMLDRLSQICQKVIGRFVTTRNISTLLNLISPCAVTEFKDKGLEYICLQMEAMLENHLLDDLDEDLLVELDEIVRDNQLARCPFARSGRAELLLHEQNPELAQDIDEERHRRVKEMAYKASQKDDDRKLSFSFKTRFGSFDDLSGASPTSDRNRRRSKPSRNEPFSPNLRPKDSHAVLIFDMDEEEESSVGSPVSPSPQPLPSGEQRDLDRLPQLPGPWRGSKGKATNDHDAGVSSPPMIVSSSNNTPSKSPADPPGRRVSQGGNPWSSSALPTTRLDLREVLSESKPPQSALSAGLAAEKRDAGAKAAPQKMSQKERKKHLQQQAERVARRDSKSQEMSQTPWTKISEKQESPWQKPAAVPTASMKDMLHPESASSRGVPNPKPLVAAETSSSRSIPRRAASPDTRFSGQKSNSTPKGSATPVRSDSQPIAPHSKTYIKRAPKPEQEIGLALADIVAQQKREQESVKEAVAKRSLQEIQQEQAFQEWWDQESRRMQEEEAKRTTREEGKDKKKEGGRRGWSHKPKAGSHRGGGGNSSAGGSNSNSTAEAATTNSRGRGRGGRGAKAP